MTRWTRLPNASEVFNSENVEPDFAVCSHTPPKARSHFVAYYLSPVYLTLARLLIGLQTDHSMRSKTDSAIWHGVGIIEN